MILARPGGGTTDVTMTENVKNRESEDDLGIDVAADLEVILRQKNDVRNDRKTRRKRRNIAADPAARNPVAAGQIRILQPNC